MENQKYFQTKFTSALKPMFYFGRFFGLAPFDRSFKTLKFWCVYSIFMVAFSVFGFVNKLQRLFNDEKKMPAQDLSTSVVLTFVTYVSIIVTLISSLIKKNDYASIVTHFCELDIILGLRPETYDQMYLFLCKEVSVFSVFLFTMMVSDFIYICLSNMQWWVQISYIIYLVTLASPLIFLNLVYLLKMRFKILNNLLENLGKSTFTLANPRVSTDKLFLVLELRSMKANEYEENFLSGAPLKQESQENQVELINNLRRVHFKLYNIAMLSNRAFGQRNLILLLCYLVTVSSVTYLLVKQILIEKNINAYNVHHWVSNIIWLMMVCLILVSMSTLCNLAAGEGNLTAVMVRERLLFKKNLGHAVVQELNEFANQLAGYHITFTAAGVFEINNTLLLSVAATVASYIVVLLNVKS